MSGGAAMFVFSFKMTKRILLILCIGVLGIASLLSIPFQNGDAKETVAKVPTFRAETQQERIAFLKNLGWEAEETPLEVSEVIIPEEFDPVYEKYNAIQKAQSFDLLKYRGKRVKRYTYSISNYPEYNGPVVANILAYQGKIIGGDICSLALDGFMHGFSK